MSSSHHVSIMCHGHKNSVILFVVKKHTSTILTVDRITVEVGEYKPRLPAAPIASRSDSATPISVSAYDPTLETKLDRSDPGDDSAPVIPPSD